MHHTNKSEQSISYFWIGIFPQQKIALMIVKPTCKQHEEEKHSGGAVLTGMVTGQEQIFTQIKVNQTLLKPIIDHLAVLQAHCGSEVINFAEIAQHLNEQLEISLEGIFFRNLCTYVNSISRVMCSAQTVCSITDITATHRTEF